MINLSDNLLHEMVKDDFPAWQAILKNKKLSANLLTYLDKHKFSFARLRIVREVIKENFLLDTEFKRLFHSDFTLEQLYFLTDCLSTIMIHDYVLAIANPKYNLKQMKQVATMYKNAFPQELLDIAATPEMSSKQMSYIVHLFKCEIQINALTRFAHFTEEVMEKIHNCCHDPYNFTVYDIENLINLNLDDLGKIEIAISAICDGIDNLDILHVICDSDFSPLQVEQLKKSFLSGLNISQLKLIANPEFDIEQISALTNILLQGLSIQDTQIIACPSLFPDQIYKLAYAFSCGLTREQVKSMACSTYSVERMQEEIQKFQEVANVAKLREIIDKNYS